MAKPKLARDIVGGLVAVIVVIVLLGIAGAIDVVPAGILVALLMAGGAWLLRRNRDPAPRAPEVEREPPNLVSQAFLDAIPDPVVVLNDAREVLAVNAPAREALGVHQLGGDLAMSVRHPKVLAAVEALASGAASVSEQISLPVPIARTYTFHAARAPHGGDPRGARIVLVLHDETRARRAEQTQADFVANASHELRSPLSALIGLIETLRGPAVDDAAARERFLSIMHTEALRMTRLVDDLMSLSRVEINEHVPPREAVDIEEVLAGVATALSVRAAGKSMTIGIACSPALPKARGDTDQLTQVFHNLLDNAVKYGKPGTGIEVTALPVAPNAAALPANGVAGIAVSVRDHGDGIAPVHLPRLTERFYRVDAGRSRRMGGTGLGLAIVKHIVNRHRGRLAVDSTKGEGSTFTVFLPAAREEPRAKVEA